MKKVILLIILILVVVLLAVVFSSRTKPVEIRNIQYFSFSYSSGSEANANANYSLRLQDGAYLVSVKPRGLPEEDMRTYEVDESFVRKLEQFLVSQDVGKWNGFDRSDKRVMDGSSFSLYITLADGSELSAGGYMKFPKNYAAVRSGIEAMFTAPEKGDLPL